MIRKVLLSFFLITYLAISTEAQCNDRNLTAAEAVGRPCRKLCYMPGDKRCKKDKECVCDHECGYSCISLENYCQTPPKIPNVAEVRVFRKSGDSLLPVNSLSYRYDDIAEYVCIPGYKKEFQEVKHYCHGRKQWTGNTTCIKSCHRYRPSKVRQHNMLCGTACKTDSDCGTGFDCLCDSYCGARCVSRGVDCGSAPPAENARIEYKGEGFYAVAYYSCEEGYFASSGDSTRRCTGGGTWEGRLVTCERITCGDPTNSIASTGGRIVSGEATVYHVGHEIQFACTFPKILFGSEQRTCEGNGQWSGNLPVCDFPSQSRCNHPGIPINGNLLPNDGFSQNSFVEFECDIGFAMVGERRQECLYFLQWSDDGAPKCIDPRIPTSSDEVIHQLQESTKNIQAAIEATDAGLSISSRSVANLDVFFVIDISDDVRHDVLNKSLEFAKDRAETASRGGSIKCTVIVFASTPLVQLELGTYTTQKVVDTIHNILVNRENIAQDVGYRRNTEAALISLRTALSESFKAKEDRQRFVFLLINGIHTTGNPPHAVIDRIKRDYKDEVPEVYVVAYGNGYNRGTAYQELQYLAVPNKFFLVNPSLASLERSKDDSTRNTGCGQAGDVDGVKKQASIGFILGGNKAKPGAWPWHAVVTQYHINVARSFTNLRGGGTLLNNQWVLTAAHLFQDVLQVPGWSRSFLVTLGVYRLPRSDRERLSPHAQTFDAEEIIMHSRFSTDTFDYDIALIRLGRRYEPFGYNWIKKGDAGFVNFTSYINPVCLPCTDGWTTQFLQDLGVLTGRESKERQCEIEADWMLQRDDQTEKNALTIVTGFGSTVRLTAFEQAVPSTYLKQGLIRMQSDLRCSYARDAMVRVGLSENVTYTERMVCGVGGSRENTDACKGDSGGGFVRELKSHKNGESRWLQIGVVSWGWGCGQTYRLNGRSTPFPGFYSNIYSLLSWIKNGISQALHDCPRDLSLVEEERKCGPACEYDVNCKGARKRCRCDNVCGMSCFNPDALCREAPQIPNGRVEGGRGYGLEITYSCDEGFNLQGPRKRTCRSDRRYSGIEPSCIAIECVLPPPPPSGSVSPSRPTIPLGNTVTFLCDDGYVMVGRPENTLTSRCQPDGTWSNDSPRCVEVRCDVIPAPPFGRVSTQQDEVAFGKSIVYTCEERYRMVGRRAGFLSMTCQRDGTWSARIPRCVLIECPLPLPPHFGSISSSEASLPQDEVIVFTCNDRYRMVGQPSGRLSATCLRDGSWSNPPPVCLVISCRVPDTPDLVVKSTNLPFVEADRTVTYECEDGNRMVNRREGRLTAVCRRDGSWSAPVPVCVEISCLVPDAPQFGRVSRTGMLKVDEEIVFSCLARYRMLGNERGQVTAACRRDGTWSAGVPQCIERTCIAPDAPQFGTISRRGLVPVNEQAIYRCSNGYRMVDEPVGFLAITCLRDGGWSAEAPVCEESDENPCLVPPPLGSSPPSVQRSVSTGSTITFTCPDQFNMVSQPAGQLVSTCQRDGTWNVPVPACRGLGCTRDRSKCSFPFVHRSHYYYSCTTIDQPRGIPWCSKTPTNTKFIGACAQCDISPIFKVLDPSNPDPVAECFDLVTATMDHVIVTSPNFPNGYDNNLNCYWIIRSDSPNHQVEVVLNTLISERCCDFMRINDGSSKDATSLVVFRGHVQNEFKAFSSFGVLYVSFVSDETHTYAGFQFTYRSYNYDNCGEPLRATPSLQTLSSPGYPDNYPDSTYCQWLITAPPGMQVQLTILMVSIEHCCDGLVVYDGDTEEASLSYHARGNATIASPTVSTKGKVLVTFRSDAAVNAQGFMGTYQSVSSPAPTTRSPPPECGGELIAPGTGYNNFTVTSGSTVGKGPFSCTYTITAPVGSQVRVWFGFVGFKNIWCTVFDGRTPTSRKVGAFTSNPTDFLSYHSTTGALRLQLFADPLRNQETFYGYYEVYVPGGDERTSSCGGRYTATSSLRYISTPNWPRFYPNNQRCTWVIYSGANNKFVYLHVLGVMVESTNDNFEIHEGNLQRRVLSVNGRLNTRFTVVSRTAYLSILFTSNESVAYGGFRATYESKTLPSKANILFN